MTDRKTRYYSKNREELRSLIPDSVDNVLEIGCGAGAFRETVGTCNDYWGVEPNQNIAMAARERLDNILIGFYNDVSSNIPNNYFDLIVCNDVIEHMDDYMGFLTSIQDKVKTDGYILVSIPNVRYVENLYELLIKKDWNYGKAGILDSTHLRFFTLRSFMRVIRKSNLVLDDMLFCNPYKSNGGFKGTIKALFFYFLSVMIGKDILYLQFAFRLKCKSPVITRQSSHSTE